MTFFSNRSLPWLGAVLVVGFAIALATRSVEALQVERRVAQLAGQMKPVCVGRLLIDLPEGARHEFSQARIAGIHLATMEETSTEFKSRLDERQAQLMRTAAPPGRANHLELVRAVKNRHGLAGRIFVHGRGVVTGQPSSSATVKRLRRDLGRDRGHEAVTVEALVHGNGVSIDLTAELSDPTAIGQLSTLIAGLVPNPKNIIPFEPGFCMDRAYLRGPPAPGRDEDIMMTAWHGSRPQIAFTLMHARGTGADRSGLLTRSTGPKARTASDTGARVSVQLARLRSIGRLAGAEVVEEYVQEDAATFYNFWWEMNGSEDKELAPHLALTMFTGGGPQGPDLPPLSQAMAYGLWDKVVHSLRLRADDGAKSTQAGRPQAGSHRSALAETACARSDTSQCAVRSSPS